MSPDDGQPHRTAKAVGVGAGSAGVVGFRAERSVWGPRYVPELSRGNAGLLGGFVAGGLVADTPAAVGARSRGPLIRVAVAAIVVPLFLAGLGVAVWPGFERLAGPPAEHAVIGQPAGQLPGGPLPGGTADEAGRARITAILASTPLLFAADSAALTPQTSAAIARIAPDLASIQDRIEVVGHTADGPGPEAVALQLSRARAEAVRAELIAAGVGAARITTRGVGDAEPLATPELSRRVEITLVRQEHGQ